MQTTNIVIQINSAKLPFRQFITRAEVIAIDDNLTNKGDHICLLLFSDCVEVSQMFSNTMHLEPRVASNTFSAACKEKAWSENSILQKSFDPRKIKRWRALSEAHQAAFVVSHQESC